MSTKLNKSTLVLLYTFLLPIFSFAQGATPKAVSSTNNLLAIVMIIIAFVLAFVIWGMGQVLITLTKQLMEKTKQAGKIATVLLIICLSFSVNSSHAQAITETAVLPSSINYEGMNYVGFWLLASVIIIEFVAILFILFFINRIQQELVPAKIKKPLLLKAWWSRLDKKVFTRAVSIEKEADILLDHDYDGIKELDNALPPWWKYGFYITIVVAIIYLLNFHVLGYGQNPTEEYQSEVMKAKESMAEYAAMNADKIDENNIKMSSKAELEKGKEIFTSVCWTCHGKLGEGGVGPNLTDQFWIHKGSLNDIYRSIKIGYPDKGMQSWEKNYSGKEMSELAGYIKTLIGTNPPNPKIAQGDIFIEDSTKKINDGFRRYP